MTKIEPEQQELFSRREMESPAPATLREMIVLYEKSRKLGKRENICKKADDASQRIPLIGITGYQLLWIAVAIPVIIIICIAISGKAVWIGDLIADCILGLLCYLAMRGIFIDFPSFGFTTQFCKRNDWLSGNENSEREFRRIYRRVRWAILIFWVTVFFWVLILCESERHGLGWYIKEYIKLLLGCLCMLF